MTTPEQISHPLEILKEEMEARCMTVDDIVAAWTRASCLPKELKTQVINEILEGGPVTAMGAYGLAEAFGTSHNFWFNLQTQYDNFVYQQAK